MKRHLLACAVLCLVFCLSAPMAMAASDAGTLGVGLRVGYHWYAENTVEGYEFSFDPSGQFGVNALYFPVKNFSVELAGEFGRTKVNADGVEMGDLQQIAALVTLRYQPTLWDRIMPYVGVGGGYYFNEFDHISMYIAQRWRPTGYVPNEIELKDNWGYHAAVGFDLPIDKQLIKGAALNMEGRYNWTSTEEDRLPNPSEIKLNGFILSGGFKFFFK